VSEQSPSTRSDSAAQAPARSEIDDAKAQRTLRQSLHDAAVYSVMIGTGETYLSAFALHLKAGAQEIAWLASVPQLLGSWMQLFSAWLGERGVRRKKMILTGALAQAVLWIPIALLPVLFPAYAAPLLVACVVLYQAGSNLAAPQWGSLMRELVPENQRGRYFAKRTAISSLITFLALICGGAALHAFTQKNMALAGFLALFAVAALARLVSCGYLSRMYDPEHPLARRGTLRQTFHSLRGSPFLRFSIFFALMQGATAICSPFFSLHMLRNLEFSYLQYTAGSATTILAQFLALNAWGKISDQFGNRLIFATTGFIIPFLPALWTLSDSFWYLLVLQALGGLSWAGFSLSAGNFIYDLLPDRRIAPYMAVHNVLMNAGVFCGAMLGGYLATHLPTELHWGAIDLYWTYPIYAVFFISSLARLVVAAAFLPRIPEVRSVEAFSVRGMIFRVTRIHAISGMVFDIVGGIRRGPRRTN
jgi:MFS family permease